MLVIRLQRTGRHGHAQFRVVVQDSRRTPTSGKIVASIGSYDPHAKTTILNKEKAQTYLNNGAQPSPRVTRLLKSEGVKLPKWVEKPSKLQGKIKNAEKLRRNRPPEPKEEPQTEIATESSESAIESVETSNENSETESVENKPEETGTAIAEEIGETANELASEQAEAAAETADPASSIAEQNS